ncbi:InlB B-repeat-containing protein [Methylomicrobium sp. RS1]|jgi:hypothetical protein|uniref:InlB B-repeat-containing protein n=1 Tax=Candidatus Methylomicrobium oryzae TaxID=2802053 RepID=UPI001922DEE1|nr:hypothetical protein [Methylomicrobium sp. RS1]MBL1265263.1 hypothetical protein [Methylomicrobium sp. RS1]
MNRTGSSHLIRKVNLLFAVGFLTPSLAAAGNYIVGSLGNFDAANFEGQDAHGFEVQLEGIQPGDMTQPWTGNKYGQPVVEPYATGSYVRYQSPYDTQSHQFPATTIAKTPGINFSGTCYQWNPSYLTAGCDHFGIHLNYTAVSKATAVTYRWLLEDSANPGQLIGSANTVTVPTPNYYFQPPPLDQPTAPPVLVAEVQLPPPPPPPEPEPVPQYGDAAWMKVYKTELNREIELSELVSTNPDGTPNTLVPQDAAQVETDWVLMQPSPPPDGKHRQRGKYANQGSPHSGSRAVVRRYETYAYTGNYDPLTHEAVCGGDGSCNAPLDGELGDLLVAQMAAANIAVPSLSVSTSGNGSVVSNEKSINCGKTCSSSYEIGTVITLNASAGSGSIFTGWQGACQGTSPTCNVTVNDQITTSATFVSLFSVSAATSNSGTVTATPNGIDRTINCGKDCSAKFAQGTVVTFTAIPPAGKQFLGWSGDCAGTGNVCVVTVNKSMSVKASFSR